MESGMVVSMVTRQPSVQARYYGSNMVTDNISVCFTAGRPCLGPVRLVLAVEALLLD